MQIDDYENKLNKQINNVGLVKWVDWDEEWWKRAATRIKARKWSKA